MHKQIFVNLAVDKLDRSKAFFSALGFNFDPRFTNDQAACLILGENLYAMLLVKDLFKSFTRKSLCDPKESTEALVGLSCDSRGEVDALVAKALAAGGTAPRAPQDYGFMYGHGFEDIDGHIWELIYMDPNAKAPG
ncbi:MULTISPECIES: VOC family protein [Paraburkholderia]|jgi:predicted lactoylglutathione lyase|uniref:Glyoxalase/bleomycin resistance/extradiol dioxygenase family protein n=1 Tax=Paraburkholderia strydomiana TaxID=1245417 RepID=A0ABW9C5N6_9BURK|nr:VOC family protein [Paraburkholderia caledonica]TCG01752.1 glyoxalase/bleomycin resistance/extradiol dioxygenase family protein [Paraburkholderia strydomiana]CAH2903526.1 MAG: Glyoxalase family protein [uncultured Paraburkholderia sp.]CAH2940508.1 MAG: Glyoxalase family protein [uncultured Paraburkholderia sp.]